MKSPTPVFRKPQGDVVDPETLSALRALLAERGALPLAQQLGVSLTALHRAAAGVRVLRGTRMLIRTGIENVGARAGGAAGTPGNRR